MSFRRFGKFAVVGAVSFGVDAAVLMTGLKLLQLDPYTARAISFVMAMSASWAGNRLFTFRDRPRAPPGRQWLAFAVISLGGLVFNYGTYAVLVTWVPLALKYPVLAAAAGTLAGMFFNFFGSSAFVFRKT